MRGIRLVRLGHTPKEELRHHLGCDGAHTLVDIAAPRNLEMGLIGGDKLRSELLEAREVLHVVAVVLAHVRVWPLESDVVERHYDRFVAYGRHHASRGIPRGGGWR